MIADGGVVVDPPRHQRGTFYEGLNFAAASAQAQEEGNLEAALEYSLLAKQHVRAAQLALQLERPQQAAEIYQSIGELERAAKFFERAGLKDKAHWAREELAKELDDHDADELKFDFEADERTSGSGFKTEQDRARRVE